MPPRHGKSSLISQYFPAWYLGTFPDRRIILASYEADFAASWGRKARDVMEQFGPSLFNVRIRSDSSAANRWDLQGTTGGMMTTGVGGPATGKGADILICDDVVKNAEEAMSATHRQKAWDWYASTAYTRLEPGASIITIMTRWHHDDLAGRILADAANGGEKWEVIDFPALAFEKDALGRQPGEALWPERYDASRLAEIQRTMGLRWFSALYQQRPMVQEGALFRREWFRLLPVEPACTKRVRYWDLAGTEAKGGSDPDWTVGALVGVTDRKEYVVLDVRRMRGTPKAVQDLVRQTADVDGTEVPIWMEEEPGSSGKNTIDNYTRHVLAGFAFKGDRVTGDKTTRATPLSSQAEAGNVYIVKGNWNKDFLEEMEVFPFGAHDDQCDAASGGFNKVALDQKREFKWF